MDFLATKTNTSKMLAAGYSVRLLLGFGGKIPDANLRILY